MHTHVTEGARREVFFLGLPLSFLASHGSPLDARRSTLDARRSTLDARRSTLDARRSTLDARRSTLDARRSTLDARRSTLDARRSTLDARRSTLDALSLAWLTEGKKRTARSLVFRATGLLNRFTQLRFWKVKFHAR